MVVQYVGIQQSDCSEFDSSWETGQPASFPLAGVIPGFSQGLEGMKVGGRRYIAMPADMAYGDADPEAEAGAPGQPSGTLVFVVDLEDVTETVPPPEPAIADEAALAAAEARGKPTMVVPDPLPTELTVVDDVVGEGAEVAEGGQVLAHYVGIDATGTEFDSSWERGEPAAFGLDQVIAGWTEGLVGMKVGGRRTLVIPADMAYGDDDSSGRPTGTLIFTVDMVGTS